MTEQEYDSQVLYLKYTRGRLEAELWQAVHPKDKTVTEVQ